MRDILTVDFAQERMWARALAGRSKAVGQLIQAFRSQVEAAVGSSTLFRAVRGAASAAHTLLGSHYGSELHEIAEIASASPGDVLLANLAYDLTNAVGCSTVAVATPNGPLHARNLDWEFPGNLLRRYTTAMSFENTPAGPYTAVGWPGFFGALTAMAPGRYSVTVNFVGHHTQSGVAGLVQRTLAGHWPVPWAVRQALDGCPSFSAAVQYLQEVPLLSPVIFVVSGVRNGEHVVIERSCEESAAITGNALCVTNHYQTAELEQANVDLEGMDTEDRLAALRGAVCPAPSDAGSALRLLSRRSLLSDITQHQVVMMPAAGELVVRVPGMRAVRYRAGGTASSARKNARPE